MIPEIGSIRANRLLAHFGNARNVLEGSIKELDFFDGIGKGLANKIKNVINFIYLQAFIISRQWYHIAMPGESQCRWICIAFHVNYQFRTCPWI